MSPLWGDEDGLMLLMDALLNFSHAYIPDKRGGRMDLPLILTTRIDPSEVDKEAHNIDTLFMYPLEFYEATLKHENPKELESIMGLIFDGAITSCNQFAINQLQGVEVGLYLVLGL